VNVNNDVEKYIEWLSRSEIHSDPMLMVRLVEAVRYLLIQEKMRQDKAHEQAFYDNEQAFYDN
jgi:hypothetical protein